MFVRPRHGLTAAMIAVASAFDGCAAASPRSTGECTNAARAVSPPAGANGGAHPAVAGSERTAVSAAASGLAALGWLTGSWRGSGADGVTEEHWTTPDGGMMVGMGRTTSNGRLVFFEYMSIRQDGDVITFNAMPNGGSSVPFRMTERREHEVVFANPAHDFPTRIMYRLEPDGSLYARVDGAPREPARAEEFRYSPVR